MCLQCGGLHAPVGATLAQPPIALYARVWSLVHLFDSRGPKPAGASDKWAGFREMPTPFEKSECTS